MKTPYSIFLFFSMLLTPRSSLPAPRSLPPAPEYIAISTVNEFKEFADSVNVGNSFAGTTIVLTTDIVLDEDEFWMPIGTTDAPFQGIFDGQGHWVSNLYVNVDGEQTGNVAGLFGCIGEQGIVRRVGVESGSIHIAAKTEENVNCYVGGIAGLCQGHIEQCINYATVLGNYLMASVGGIAGALGFIGGGETEASIEDCYNQGRIFTNKTEYSDWNNLGGIVGLSDGAVRRVYVSPDVEITNAAETNRIANLNYGAPIPEDAYFEGDLTGFTLDGSLNTQGDYSVWTFVEGELPELTTFVQPSNLLGDVNGDGIVNMDDMTALIGIILSKDATDSTPRADVNGDGEISIADVTALVNVLLE